ncbi:MAG: hypothetical protein Tp136SUR676911_62 [Prokaryotic dsDNA virus sp.]|jgi:ATP-dependent protease HslVU (ClpYQ) peptidase subunit|nr:MAG: hypothetical protein Tp136SUR676911_62 [Prokaryotic dsDNA virus sp.]|tara:strand:- start:40484 stop:40981 length:498 start_codon:yes stop_codon:yes gene_type:complete
MTTIVYDHKSKQIAIDSRVTAGTLISSNDAAKWVENDNGHWFLCGTTADYSQLIEMTHNDKPEVQPDSSAIMANSDGVWLVCFNGDYCCHAPLDHSRAIGSGADFALAALDHGKSAKEAVEYAMTRDTGTGGKVHVFNVEAMEFIDSYRSSGGVVDTSKGYIVGE